MTLKNSFLTDSIENFKRRSWVFWIQFLSFFCSYPGVLLLGLNSARNSYDSPERILQRMQGFTFEILDMNGWNSVLIVGLAVLAGIQAFSYLHDKKQVDFYHSQPVSRNRRFLVIWFNGIVSFLVSYLINILLAAIVAGSFGSMTATIAGAIPKAILAHFLLFLAIYHVTILAVMLTGHTLVSLIGVVVLLFYELAARALYFAYASSFFHTFGSEEADKIYHTILSPVVTFFTYQFGRYDSYIYQTYSYSETMFSMVGLALFFGLAGWLLYRARASESHGKSIAFPIIKEPLKVLLLLLIGACGGLFIYAISGASNALGIGGTIFAVIIGHIVIQLIYEVDFRAVRKKVPTLIVSTILAVFIFVAFRWDIFSYDDRIPARNRVDSVALNLSVNDWDNRRVLADGTEVDAVSYWRHEMELTDLDLIYRLLDNRISFEEHMQYETSEVQNSFVVNVVFNLDNGKTSNRKLYLNYVENLDVLNEIFHLEEYQHTTNQLTEDNFAEDFNIYNGVYNNGLMSYKVPDAKVKQLVEAYAQDMDSVDFAQLCNSNPIGRLEVGGFGIQDRDYINTWWVTIYPEFTRTVALLEQEGIRVKAVCDQEYLDRIRNITIHYTDVAAMEADGAMLSGPYERKLEFVNQDNADLAEAEKKEEADFDLIGSYTVEPAKLKEILDGCMLQEVNYWRSYPNLDPAGYVMHTYLVSVDLKGSEYDEYGYEDSYYFFQGQMPEFVKDLIIEASGVLPEYTEVQVEEIIITESR